MLEEKRENEVNLRGCLAEGPVYSHESRGERFFRFSLEVRRLSGTRDILHILAREALLEALPIGGTGEQVQTQPQTQLQVRGELRSFNNRSGRGPKLVISVFARELDFAAGEDENSVILSGTLCKAPNYRVTPMGREICDLMLAVNRHYGRSDYLPCIVWGQQARTAAGWTVGEQVRLSGRLQSRGYTKVIDGQPQEKTAYEVSVMEIRQMDPA